MTKRWSRGYTPALIEELDMPISGAALQLLLRMRRDSDMRESDGFLTKRQLDALAVEHGMSKTLKRKALNELISVALVHEIDGGFKDSHFDQWCRTSAERKDLREKWNAAKREPKSGSAVESPTESTQDSTRTASASASTSVSIAAAASNGLPADFEEVVMPTQDAMATIARAWQDVTGKDPTHSDVGFFAHWLDQYRLTDSQVIQEMGRVTARQGDKGEPVKTAKYLDQVMRELSERTPHNRSGNGATTPASPYVVPRGIVEPPEDLAS
jgi:hypothetical protein